MVNVGFPDAVLDASEAQAAAQSLGLEIATLEIRRAGDIVPAFESLKDHADALYVTADALLNANRIRINTLALGARLPTMHEFRESRRGGRLQGPRGSDGVGAGARRSRRRREPRKCRRRVIFQGAARPFLSS